MLNDPFPKFSFLTLTQLGELFGVSSHVVGRRLHEIGLRLPNGEPCQRAIDAGLVQKVTPGNGSHFFWSWEKERTIQILELIGCRRVQPQPPAPTLTGPFSARSNGEGDGFEISDANGVVAIWGRGEGLSKTIVALLNLAHKHGRCFA